MKVLLDLQYLNVASSGIKTYMMELARAALTHPHPEIEWIFSHDPDTQAADQTFKGNQNKIQRLNYHLDYFRWKEFQLPDMVKKYQPDILICPDFISPAASLPCKRLTVIHDAFFWQMPGNYPKWWRTYFLNLLNKGLKEKTNIITTSEYSKKALHKHLRKKLPISVVYQAPKSSNGKVEMSFLEEHQLLPKRYFFHLGTFDKRKNLPLLVRAFDQFQKQTHSDFKLVLAGGEGQSTQLNDWPVVNQLVDEMGLRERVILTGYVNDTQVKTLYEEAFAYVFPSENEGFGIPVVEAMGYGLPVIHSDQPALMEVSAGAGLICKTGSINDLAEKMVLLRWEKSLREELIQKGLTRAQDFSPKNFIEAYHQIILSLRD